MKNPGTNLDTIPLPTSKNEAAIEAENLIEKKEANIKKIDTIDSTVDKHKAELAKIAELEKKYEERDAEKTAGKEYIYEAIALAVAMGKTKQEILEMGEFTKEEVNNAFEKMGGEVAKTADVKKVADKADAAKKIEAISADAKKILTDKEQTKTEEDNLVVRLKTIGLNQKDFETIPQWKGLSYGQKLLIIEQASQDTLSRVKEQGEKRFQEKNTIKNFKNPLKWNLLSSGLKVWHKMGKSAWISKEEKDVIKEFQAGQLKPNMQSLKSIVEITTAMNLDIVEKNGRASIQFMENKAVTLEDKKMIEEYNDLANKWARMPDAWKTEKAAAGKGSNLLNQNKSQYYEQYQDVKIQYEQARSALLYKKVAQYEAGGMKKETALKMAQGEMKKSDESIRILQIDNTNPDALSELKKIENDASWKKLINNENIWRVGYMGIGFGTRMATTATLGLVAAPLVSGIIGGWRANRKAGQKINKAYLEGREEETFLERREAGKKGTFEDKNANLGLMGTAGKLLSGFDVNTKEITGFVDADSQIQRLTSLMQKIENLGYAIEGPTQIEKNRLISQLTTRIEYIEQKHEENLINYGKNHAGVGYALLKLMSEAEVAVATHEMSPLDIGKMTNLILINKLDPTFLKGLEEYNLKDSVGRKIGERRAGLLKKVMDYNLNEQELNQTNFKTKETARGVIVGAGFAVLGMKIREWWQGDVVEAPVTDNADNIPPVVNEAPLHNSVDAEVLKGQGAIATIRELKVKLEAEYPDEATRPASIQHILETDETKLAMEYGMYQSNDVAESALTKVGDKFVIDKDGNVTYHQVDGNHDTLLEKGTEAKGSGLYEGRMLDSDNSDHIEHLKHSVVPDQEVPEGVDDIVPDQEVPEGVSAVVPIQEVPEGVEDVVPDQKVPERVEVSIKDDGSIVGHGPNANSIDDSRVTPGDVVADDNVYPTRSGGFSNVGDNNTPAISPVKHIYEGNGGVGPDKNIVNTENIGDGSDLESGVRNIDIKTIEADPRHLETAASVKKEFGRQGYGLVINKMAPPREGLTPGDNTIDGIKLNEWNKDVNNMFEANDIKFNSYEDFTKERKLQQLFGHARKAVEYIDGENTPTTHIEYFRDTKDWATINKIPAKDFFGSIKSGDELIDGSKISKENLDELVKNKILTPSETSGKYVFTHQGELERLSDTYARLIPKEQLYGNNLPLVKANGQDENIEEYISRISKKVYETDDGTLYGTKKNVDFSQSNRDYADTDGDGSVIRSEFGPLRRVPTGSISPTRGIYQTSVSNVGRPDYGIVQRGVDGILGWLFR